MDWKYILTAANQQSAQWYTLHTFWLILISSYNKFTLIKKLDKIHACFTFTRYVSKQFISIGFCVITDQLLENLIDSLNSLKM